MNSANTFDTQHFFRVDRTFCNLVPSLNLHTFMYTNTGAVSNSINLSFCFALNFHFATVLRLANFFDYAVDLRDDRLTFRVTRFEELLDTRQTLSDIVSCNTTGMERTHCKLCSWFTDGLCSDNTNCFTDFNMFTCCQVTAITDLTYTVTSAAAEYRTNLQALNTSSNDCRSFIRIDQFVTMNDNLTCLRMFNSLEGVASFDTVIQSFDNFLTIRNVAD